jgi:hypothetical protein
MGDPYCTRRPRASSEQATVACIPSSTVSAADIRIPAGCQVFVDSQDQVLMVRDDDPTRVPVLRRSQEPVVAKAGVSTHVQKSCTFVAWQKPVVSSQFLCIHFDIRL